jgi:hypothetical protein
MMRGGFWSRLQKYLPRFLQVPPLTPGRIAAAFGIAVVVDALQLALGPLGWSMADEVLDVATMVAICWLLGFHPLLLPTLLIEIVPVADALPTWTGCVGLVVALRRREQRAAYAPPALPPGANPNLPTGPRARRH